MDKIERIKAIALLLATAVLWSFGGVFIKQIAWHPLAIAGVRSAIAALVLLLVLRRSHLNWSKYQIAGAVSYAATVILFVAANKLTTAANAILLQYTAPVYVALLSPLFLKERVSPFDWLLVATAIVGIALFFLDKLSAPAHLGNLLALLSALCIAFLILLMRKQRSKLALGSIFLGNILAALTCLPFMFGSLPNVTEWAYLAFLGIFQLGLSWVLYSLAIETVTALEAIMIPIIEPVLNPVWVLIFLGERPGTWALVGGAIVIASVLARSLKPPTPTV